MSSKNKSGEGVEQTEETDQREMSKYTKIWIKHKSIIASTIGFLLAYTAMAGGLTFTELPEWVFIYGTFAVTSVLIGVLTANNIYEYVSPYFNYKIIETNFMNKDNSVFDFSMYEIGEKTKRNTEYKGGKPYITPNRFILSEGYDMEEKEIKGHWLESLSNYELLRYKSNLDQAKNQMMQEVLEAEATKANAKMASMTAQIKLMEIIVNTLSENSTISGKEVKNVIDEEIDESTLINNSEEAIGEEINDNNEEVNIRDVMDKIKNDDENNGEE